MKVATLLPTFLLRLVLEVVSLHKLYLQRVKYMEATGKEPFFAMLFAT
jgi:hypothetical protein